MRITGKSAVIQKQSSLVDQSSKSDNEGPSGAGRKATSKCASTLEFQVLEAEHGHRHQLPQFHEDIENKRRYQLRRRVLRRERSKFKKPRESVESDVTVADRRWLMKLLEESDSDGSELDEGETARLYARFEHDLPLCLKIHRTQRKFQKQYHADAENAQFRYYAAGMLNEENDQFSDHQQQLLQQFEYQPLVPPSSSNGILRRRRKRKSLASPSFMSLDAEEGEETLSVKSDPDDDFGDDWQAIITSEPCETSTDVAAPVGSCNQSQWDAVMSEVCSRASGSTEKKGGEMKAMYSFECEYFVDAFN